jgi:3D-(3,5/4)-trihydroxycyclohexane-1,2-dione acylhydrolase (decyclizing)
MGGIGVTGSQAANTLAEQADVIIAIGTRLQDFTTESRTLFNSAKQTLIQINVGQFDASKHGSVPLVGDALVALKSLNGALSDWCSDSAWAANATALKQQWHAYYQEVTAAPSASAAAPTGILPSDAQVLGAIKRQSETRDVVVCAAGGLPGELHKLWLAEDDVSYHLEYGFSCMGYEIAGGLGVKMAHPKREVIVVVGDGSYMMMNSELATSVMLGHKIIVVVLDNRGFGCINRLQNATGNASFNNLLEDCLTVEGGAAKIDFASHARAMGATAESVSSIQELELAIQHARAADSSYVITIDTDPHLSADNGEAWWDVAIPEQSSRSEVQQAFKDYQQQKIKQPY